MKTLSTPFFVLGSLLLATAVTAAPETRARGYQVTAVETLSGPTIESGTSEFTVRRILGEPVRKLDPATWVYTNYCALPAQVPGDDRRTLVITFAAGKVADLKLVNDSAEIVIAASLQARPAPTGLLAKR